VEPGRVERPSEFQFLLGRLETRRNAAKDRPKKQFQFLLGRLETPQPRWKRRGRKGFQFLLGRLETPVTIPATLDLDRFNSS